MLGSIPSWSISACTARMSSHLAVSRSTHSKRLHSLTSGATPWRAISRKAERHKVEEVVGAGL
uniref:Uncharacterized protein n=1 Tax=Arundo donax TaxID=35708 RepID=A0A0A9AAQ2_ARUDO